MEPNAYDAVQPEREMLVRFCARYTGNPEAAEDLAHQTLLRAWEREEQLREPRARRKWLLGIARNVCSDWGRRRARELPLRDFPSATDSSQADDIDLDLELERDDLAALLDRALSLLPEETREALLQKYVEELSHAEIADVLGLTERAVEARLYRGKLALRRILATDLRDEARAFGLITESSGSFQETRIWCPFCGRRRLLGSFGQGVPELTLRCPACCRAPTANVASYASSAMFGGMKSFRAAHNRLLAWFEMLFGEGLSHGALPCFACGARAAASVDPVPGGSWDRWAVPGIHIRCPVCGSKVDSTMSGRVLSLPEVRAFWRAHPRLRLLPARAVEADGERAVVTRYEDATGGTRLEVVCSLDSLRVLAIHRSDAPHDL